MTLASLTPPENGDMAISRCACGCGITVPSKRVFYSESCKRSVLARWDAWVAAGAPSLRRMAVLTRSQAPRSSTHNPT